jgi:uncharacterized protein
MASDSAHDLAHLDRVWANARTIARGEAEVSMRVLLAGAYLHDLVNLPKDAANRDQASRMSAERALPILEDLGFDPAERAAAAHAIEAHSFSAGIAPQSPEARILRDADRLDALGAIGIARVFAVSGSLGRPLYDPEDPFARARALDDRRFALDHFAVKLLRLEEDMLTPGGKEMARARTDVLRRFLADLTDEIAGGVEGLRD